MKRTLSGILFLFASMIIVNCEDPLGSGGGPNDDPDDIKKDTSIFIGKWAQVFDTSTVDKKNWWCDTIMGYCRSPDTTSFLNDSVENRENTGTINMYYYTADSIYYYVKNVRIVGNDTTYYNSNLTSRFYRIENDTLYFKPENSTDYYPCYIKLNS